MNSVIKKNLSLINHFSQLKLPWWILIIPIFNNTTYLLIFRSWFLEFKDREFMFKYYRKEMILTNGIFGLSTLLFYLFSLWYLLIAVVGYDIKYIGYWSQSSFYLLFLSFYVLFTLFFHPINLLIRPRKIILSYEKYCNRNDVAKIDFDFYNENLITYKINNCLFSIKTNLFELTHYSLFNPDLALAKEVKNADIDTMKFLPEEQKVILKERGYTVTKLPVVTGYYFWYLFSTGFWFFGTLNAIYNLLKKKDSFLTKINIVGSFYSIFWFLTNILLILFIFPVFPHLNELYSALFSDPRSYFVSAIILLIFNIIYINIIGLIISIIIRKQIPTNDI